MGRVVAIIQARMGSSRLPGKVLADIAGRPLIEHVIERAQAIKGLDEVVLNVPAQDAASFLHKTYCTVHGVPNQEKDVLASYLYVAEQERADVIMRITGDCPLLCPLICADVLRLYQNLNNPMVYCANDTLRSGYPDGLDCEVFSTHALRIAEKCTETTYEREHVTTWLRKELPNYGILSPLDWEDGKLNNAKWSVDTEADLVAVRRIHSYLTDGQFSVAETAWAYRAMVQDHEAAREKT